MTAVIAVTAITAKMVSALREATGAPLMKCKAALVETGGDLSRAESVLRERGVGTVPAQTEDNQGHVAVYVHPGSQIVGLVELACRTDFVARSEEFRAVAQELAMQVAAAAPTAISVDALPISLREQEVERVRAEVEADPKMAHKPEALRQEVARKKAETRLEEQCLLTQAYIRDPKARVGALVDDLNLRVREGVYVRRIARWQVGEPL
jgi:elongation factor Ts